MEKHKKKKTKQLFDKFSRKKWIIECNPEHIEDFFDLLKEEGIHWFNDVRIRPKENATEYIFDCKTHRFEFKYNKLRLNPKEFYPPYHFRTFTFEEFFDLLLQARIKDDPHYSYMNLTA